MTKNDIRRIYTEMVAGLLAQGYVLHPETMGGSQGEIAHIDLTNGSEILRVLMETRCRFCEGYGDLLVIRVGRCTDEIYGSRRIIWNDHLETLSEIQLDRITDNFYTIVEEGKRMAEVRMSRWDWRYGSREQRRELGDAYKSIALRWLRRQPRMKTCRLEDITRMTRRTQHDGRVCYEISARGKDYTLRA